MVGLRPSIYSFEWGLHTLMPAIAGENSGGDSLGQGV